MLWLGLHHPNWLERTAVPAMVSHRALGIRKRLPRALGQWFQDSSGFTEIDLHGSYQTSAAEYARLSRRRFDEMGNLAHVAIQDWMCEPHMLAKTGLTVAEHQRRTVDSWFDLHELEPELPWVPVLQGWDRDDYLRHAEEWDRRGVDLARAVLVGVGTVCKRQHTLWAARLFRDLADLGLRCHGFGLMVRGVLRARDWLSSADSMAWSLDGRFPQGGRCSRSRDHQRCSGCLDYALLWRRRLLDRLSQRSFADVMA